EQHEQAQAILHDLLAEFPQDRYLLQLQVAMQSPITQSVLEDTQTQTPEISVEEAFSEAKEAFQDNELNKVLEILESVYNAGFISDEFIHILTETFYRLGRYDNALLYLDEGIRQYRDTDTLIAFFTRKAQIYVAQKRWGDAVTMYETLLRLNDDKERNWQRYFIFIEMIKLYRKLGQAQSITSVLKDLMNEFPDEPFTLHIQSKLNADDDPSAIVTILDDTPIQLALVNGQIDPVDLMLLDNDKKSDYIQRLAHEIEDLIVLINETAVHYKTPMIFTPTNRDAIIYRYLRIPVKDRETFTHFASHLYLLIFDRTQTRNRQRPLPLGLLPPEFQRQHTFPREVDSIRHFYGNAHITDLETWHPPQNSIPVADILERYLGSKKSPHDSQFINLQYGLLIALRDYLNDLHQHIAKG
ncbi:MAG TPA: hypothetical protein PLZ51_00245, partial [Aggregatilineales bacterium]|nr:hypothetical protein [Aggregatilineales bacterium]